MLCEVFSVATNLEARILKGADVFAGTMKVVLELLTLKNLTSHERLESRRRRFKNVAETAASRHFGELRSQIDSDHD